MDFLLKLNEALYSKKKPRKRDPLHTTPQQANSEDLPEVGMADQKLSSPNPVRNFEHY